MSGIKADDLYGDLDDDSELGFEGESVQSKRTNELEEEVCQTLYLNIQMSRIRGKR